jgi:DNA-directed RNA polymerase specialized sigma24 family protein
MKRRDDHTSMGGNQHAFDSTHWSLIRQLDCPDKNQRDEAANKIFVQYWKPVYCYLRRKGYSNDQAKDMTQGFFCDVFIHRQLAQRVRQNQGRFRIYLLKALDRYVIDWHHKETARKRSPKKGVLLDLDLSEIGDLPDEGLELSPDRSFQSAWASGILHQVLENLKKAASEDGLSVHWNVFYAKVVMPILNESESPSLVELCSLYGVQNETIASNMIVTMKRKFQAQMRQCIRQYVDSEPEVDQEIGEIFHILSNG